MTDKEKKRHDAEREREGESDEVSREAIDRTVSEIEGADPADDRNAAPGHDGHEGHGVKDKSDDKKSKQRLGDELEKARAEAKELHERYLRSAADLENFKKRMLKEVDENRKYANEELIKAMIPTIDNLERAITHSEGSADQDALLEGIRMVYRQFTDTLAKFGVEQIASLGKPFDPNLHQALMQVKTNQSPPNTVVTEVTKGYLLNGRLIRPSMVGVSVREDNETPQESPWGDEELRQEQDVSDNNDGDTIDDSE
jgi:molecular chaperone GrpE